MAISSTPTAPDRTRSASGSTPDKVEIIQPYDMYTNRRAEPRYQYEGRGCLLFLGSQQVINCTILDQSSSGAQVLFEAIGDIPSEVWLIDLDAHIVRRGRSVWTMAHKMGLKFDFIEKLSADKAPSPKVPKAVFEMWRDMTHPKPSAPETPTEDDTFFLD